MALGSWYSRVKSWQANRANLNILYLQYADIRTDLVAALKEIAAFCEIPLNQQRLDCTIGRSQLDYMKRYAVQFDFAKQLALESNIVDQGFLRSGNIGDRGDYFSPQQVEQFQQLYVRYFQMELSNCAGA